MGVAEHRRNADDLESGVLHCQDDGHGIVDARITVDDDLSSLSSRVRQRQVKRADQGQAAFRVHFGGFPWWFSAVDAAMRDLASWTGLLITSEHDLIPVSDR